MDQVETVLKGLPERHRLALRWFVERAGAEHAWPEKLEIGAEQTLLASKAKGIYKPNWTEYALSVRQTLGGPYPDRDPVIRADGTWSYAYFQENPNPAARDDEYTNRGLVACWRDKIPVGVMRQVVGRPKARYRVLGIALVTGWDEGYFFLEGFSLAGVCRGPSHMAQMDVLVDLQEAKVDALGVFDPTDVRDGRERVVASIVRRRGQRAFRRALLAAYNGKCVLTGCRLAEVLEAAHISPYRGVKTNHPTNGLLLRSDIHVLFDLGLISIDPESRHVIVAARLRRTAYGQLHGHRVGEPNDQALRPSGVALAEHLKWSQLAP